MGEINYKPLIQDFIWSYSRIEAYHSCKWKFFLTYIRQSREDDMFYSSYGSFMHKLIERFYKKELTKEQMLTEFLIHFKDEVKGMRPKDTIVKSYVDKGIEYLKNFTEFPFEMLEVEKKLSFTIEGIPFVGIVDYLGVKDGELYIVDNKSRDLKPRSKREKPTLKDKELDEMLTQLYLYSAAIEQEYGQLPKELCFNCFKAGTFIREPFDQSRYNEVLAWAVNSVHEIEDTRDWDYDYNYFKCRNICGYCSKCEWFEYETED